MGRLDGSMPLKLLASVATVAGGALVTHEINKAKRKAVEESKRQQECLLTEINDLNTKQEQAEAQTAALVEQHHELQQKWQAETQVLVEGRFQSQRNVHALEQQLDANQVQMFAVHQERQNLARALEEAQSRATKAQATIGILQAQVAQLESLLQDAQVAGHNTRGELEASQDQLQAKSQQCNDESILKQSLQSANEQLQASHDSLQEILNRAQADAASTATALQKSQEQLTEMTILRDACVTHCKEVQASSEQQAAELQTQLEAVQGQLTTSAAKHDAEMTAVKNQVGSLQAAKEALQVQLHGVKAELRTMTEAKQQQTRRIDSLNLSRTQLQQQLTEAKANGSMVREAKEQQSQRIKALEGRIEELTRQAGVLTQAQEQATARIVKLESSHTELEQLVEALKQQAVTDQGSLAELQQQHADLQQRSQALETETSEQAQTIAGLNKLTGEQHEKTAALVALDEEKSQRIAELEACNLKLTSCNLELDGQGSKLQAKLEALQQAADQMELSVAERMGNMEAERDNLQGSLVQSQASFSAEEKARRQLEHNLAATKEHFLLLASRHAQLNNSTSNKDETLGSLRAEASSLIKQLADAKEAADSNRAALEKQLNDKSADLRQSEDRLVASVEDIKALEQEVLILTERISRYDGVCGQLQGLQTSLKDTQGQKQLLESQLASAQQATVQLTAKCDEMAQSKASQQAELDAMHAEMRSHAGKLQSAESKVEEVTQQLNAARAAVQQLEQTSAAATEQAAQHSAAALAALQQQLDALQKEHDCTATAHEELQQKHSRTVTDHQKLEKSSRKAADAKDQAVQKLQKQFKDTTQKLQAAESLSSDRLQKLSTAEAALEESGREVSARRQEVAQLQRAAQEHNRLQLSSNRLAEEKKAALQQLAANKTQLGKAQASLAELKKTVTKDAAEKGGVDRRLQQLQHEHGQFGAAKAAMQAQHESELAAVQSQLASLQQRLARADAEADLYRSHRSLQQPPPYLPPHDASGPMSQQIPAQHGQAVPKANSFAAVSGKLPAAYRPAGSMATQRPQQTVPLAARNKSLSASQTPGRVQQSYNTSAGPAQLMSSTSGAAHFPLVSHPKLVSGYNPARARQAGELEDLHEHEYISIAEQRGWSVVIPIRGDGDCGYRATAVGLVLALHALPNAMLIGIAFHEHLAQLFRKLPGNMLSEQHGGQYSASAKAGVLFFRELLLDMQGSSPAQICQRCCDKPPGCDSLVLLFRALTANLVWQSRSSADFNMLIMEAFDDTAVKPRDWKDYCGNMILQKCHNGPQGNDRLFQEKACRHAELQRLSTALCVDFDLGVKPREGQDPHKHGLWTIRPQMDPRELAAMRCPWQGLTVRLINHEAHYCLGIKTTQVSESIKVCSMSS